MSESGFNFLVYSVDCDIRFAHFEHVLASSEHAATFLLAIVRFLCTPSGLLESSLIVFGFAFHHSVEGEKRHYRSKAKESIDCRVVRSKWVRCILYWNVIILSSAKFSLRHIKLVQKVLNLRQRHEYLRPVLQVYDSFVLKHFTCLVFVHRDEFDLILAQILVDKVKVTNFLQFTLFTQHVGNVASHKCSDEPVWKDGVPLFIENVFVKALRFILLLRVWHFFLRFIFFTDIILIFILVFFFFFLTLLLIYFVFFLLRWFFVFLFRFQIGFIFGRLFVSKFLHEFIKSLRTFGFIVILFRFIWKISGLISDLILIVWLNFEACCWSRKSKRHFCD